MINEIVVFCGLPASGKSTYYKSHYYDSHIRVNLDMLKTRAREDHVIEGCIKGKQSFVVDNTNVTPEHREKYIELAKTHKWKCKCVYFDVDSKICLERNETREGRVSKVAIYTANKRMITPEESEGFDEVVWTGVSE